MEEGMICQTCGSTGFSNALLKCTICATAIEHQYCLEKRPTADEVMHWICRECKPKPLKLEVKQCAEKKKLVQEMKQITSKSRRPVKGSNKKMSAEAKFGSAWESPDFISRQPHSIGDKSNCPYVNGYGICHDETARLSILEASKSSLKNEDATTSTSSYCPPSEFMCTCQNDAYEKSEFEATLPVDNRGISAESSRKPSDHERFMRSRRRMLLPEEVQLDQVRKVNIIGDESRRKISNNNMIFQTADHTSKDVQEKQVLIQKKKSFSWSDNESELTIIGQNAQETLQANENFPHLLQVVNHTSAIGESDPGEVHKFQSEQVNLRHKRNLTKSYEYQSDVHADIIDQNTSRERSLADKSVPAFSRHAPIFQINTTVTCNRFQAASPECNNENFSPQAQPIAHHIWRGCFDVCNQECGPLVAHLSNNACERVWTTARKLPPVLRMVKLSRCVAWPKSFETSPPTDDSIALYFFAQDDRTEVSVKELLGEVIMKDLMLKIVLDEAELLVFPSIILPENSQRFQGKHYLWGAFRGRETGVRNVVMTSPSIDYPILKPLKQELEMQKRQQRIGALPEHVGDMKAATNTTKCRKKWAKAETRIDYRVGDLVLVKLPCERGNDYTLHRRQNHHYDGPFLIEKNLGKMTYKLRIPQTPHQHSIFHASLLKLHHGSKGNPNRHHRPWMSSSKRREGFNQGKSQLEHGGMSTNRAQYQTP